MTKPLSWRRSRHILRKLDLPAPHGPKIPTVSGRCVVTAMASHSTSACSRKPNSSLAEPEIGLSVRSTVHLAPKQQATLRAFNHRLYQLRDPCRVTRNGDHPRTSGPSSTSMPLATDQTGAVTTYGRPQPYELAIGPSDGPHELGTVDPALADGTARGAIRPVPRS